MTLMMTLMNYLIRRCLDEVIQKFCDDYLLVFGDTSASQQLDIEPLSIASKILLSKWICEICSMNTTYDKTLEDQNKEINIWINGVILSQLLAKLCNDKESVKQVKI